ncbi:hypothetical protein ACFY8W_19840 [Streptomyces sp. NPDC012637]|uniref:hypothetical protein n=1 Tax=Streptomyces sp. NPDC012637 TaxID=3364842 RepID=UPI0036EC5079
MLRLRLRVTNCPGRTLTLTDTPRPDCLDCQGEGGHYRHYGDYDTGEYAGTEWDPCPCWDVGRSWVLLPLPRRRPRGGYSDEPPF